MTFRIDEVDAIYSDGEWVIKDRWKIGSYSPRKKTIDSPTLLSGALKTMGCPYGSLDYIRHSDCIVAVSKEDRCPKFIAVLEDGEFDANKDKSGTNV